MSYVATDYSALIWTNGTRTLQPSGGSFPSTRIGAYTAAAWSYVTRQLTTSARVAPMQIPGFGFGFAE